MQIGGGFGIVECCSVPVLAHASLRTEANSLISNRSVPTDIVLPHLGYRDLGEAIVWLCKAVGFVENFRYGWPLSGSQMRAGKGWIMVSQTRPEDASPKELGFGTQSLTVFIE